jgi:cytidylate kinase
MAIVTISRETGSGGEDIAKTVADRLNYQYVDRKAISAEIAEHGKQWLRWTADLDEHAPSIWDLFDRSYAGYVALMEHCIYKYAVKNNAVILGRGGNWLLKDVPHALRVRVVAPLEERAKTISERLGVDEKAAEKMLRHSDHERLIFLKRAYHRDWSNADDYDMTVNSIHLGPEEVVTLILDEIPARDRNTTPEGQQMLRQLELAARVKADIVTGFPMFIPTLEVFHDGTEIVLRGVILCSMEQKHRLMDLAKGSAAPTRVRSELHHRGV